MKQQKGPIGYETSIVQAIQTLSSIAELEIDSPIAIVEKEEVVIQKMPISYRTIHWMHKKNSEKVMRVVKNTFRTILDYLKNFYRKEVGHLIQHEAVDNIKTIMTLVGEAAKRVDHFSQIYIKPESPADAKSSSVKETKEFRDLLQFYQRKIEPITGAVSFMKWTKMLPMQAVIDISKTKTRALSSSSATSSSFVLSSKLAANHLFMDLEAVKNDSDYELFFIRKEDGTRFFHPRLLRNMKLISNFEEYFGVKERVESYEVLDIWQDNQARLCATNILHANWKDVDFFIAAVARLIDNEYAMLVYRSIIALMMAAQEPLPAIIPKKSASHYLFDFLKFIRQMTSSYEYQRFMYHPTDDTTSINYMAYHLIQGFLNELYVAPHIPKEFSLFLDHLILQGKGGAVTDEVQHRLTTPEVTYNLSLDYEALVKACKPFSGMPLIKVIDALQDSDLRGYDPLLLQDLPSHLFSLDYQDHEIACLRLPSPTSQEFIDKAKVTDEFKGFLHARLKEKGTPLHLLFNLQDRTAWRDFARAHALENLQEGEEFSKVLSVVTMTKDSDFYNQVGHYQDLNQTELFIEQFLEHIASDNAGYYYPENVRSILFSGFTEALAKGIHEIFFAGQNVLTRAKRLSFIELFYLFMQLKIIEVVKPASISFTCKDGIDVGMSTTCELFLLLKLVNDRPLSHEEQEYLRVMLFGVPLLTRGRNLFSERFARFHSVLRVVESSLEELGAAELGKEVAIFLCPLFQSKILNSILKI